MKNFPIKAGLKPLPEDKRDLNLGQLINWPKLSQLPARFRVEPLSIKNQIADGNDDFCAAAAGTGMTEPKEEEELFYPFLFAAAKHESGDDPDSWGLSLRDVGKALRKWGVPGINEVGLEIKNLPADKRRRFENYPLEVRQAARKHAAKSFFFVEGPYDAYDNARAAMWYFRDKKQQIMIGVEWGWMLSEYYLQGTPEGYGHALWKNGWDASGITVVNSAGKEVGINGSHSISRESFNYNARKFGMLMVVDMTPEEAKTFMESGAKLDQVWIIQKALLLLNRLMSFIKAKPDAKPTDVVPPEGPVAPPEPPKPTMREVIHKEARRWLGKDASPTNQAPQELACVESVCYILRGAGVDIPPMLSTVVLNQWLRRSALFRLTEEAKPGNLILSVTGSGNGTVPYGHTGIFGEGGKIMSNDSNVGMWLENYTVDSWVKRWRDKGGMRIYYFEAVN